MDEVRARLLHVVARDRDGIEFRHLVGSVFNNIRDDLHRRLWWVDVGVAHHELFENVVLDGARQDRAGVALLFACNDETGEDRDDRTIHRHGNAYFIQWNTVKEDFHILDRVDSDTRLTHIAFNAGVVAVIAAVGGQIKRDRDTLLACGKGAAVECVALLGGGETRVLTDRPRTACIHRGFDAACIRCLARNPTQMIYICQILSGVERGDVDPLKGFPRQILKRAAPQLSLSQFAPIVLVGVLGSGVRCIGHGIVLLSVRPQAG